MPQQPVINNTVTITGTLGPDIDVTSLLFEYVTELKFDYAMRVIEIVYEKNNNVKRQHFDYAITATVTVTITANVTEVVIA